MLTLAGQLIKKNTIPNNGAQTLFQDTQAFGHLYRAMVGDLLHKKPDHGPSLHVQYKLLGQTDYMVGSIEVAVKGAVAAAKAALSLDIKTKERQLIRIDEKIQRKTAQLNIALRAKESLKARSLARKSNQPLPEFHNSFGLWVASKKAADGELSFLVGMPTKGKAKKKQRPPTEYANEYLFETLYLDPRIRRLKSSISNLECRKHDLQGRLARLKREKDAGVVHICFGGKAHLRKRVEASTDDEILAWKRKWRRLRTRELMLVGRKNSIGGNFLARYDVATQTLRYRAMDGKVVDIPNVRFPHGQEWVNAAVLAHDIMIRNKKRPPDQQVEGWPPGPVTWVIKDCGNAILVKCILTVPEDPYINHCYDDGCVAFDMNYDHLAVAELGHQGKLLKHWVVHFKMFGQTSDQVTNGLSEALERVFRYAVSVKKPIAMEDIEHLDKCLLYGNKKANRKVSEFAYAKMTQLAEHKGQKYKLEVRKVNPAYTSQIGKLKFMRQLGLSIHEAAAYAIGRRAMGIEDQVPNSLTHLIPEKTRKGHYWTHWAYLYNATKKMPTSIFYHKVDGWPYKTTAAWKKALKEGQKPQRITKKKSKAA